MQLRMLIAGPPGSGKGTQSEGIKARYGGEPLSTGALLREEVKQHTELGQQAESYMKQGLLVPDELVLAMVEKRLGDEFILDGFPRSTGQAEGLDAILAAKQRPLGAVVLLDVSDDVVVERLKARGREDDKEEIIRERLKVYHQQTEPMIQYFRKQGLVETVPSTGNPQATDKLIAERLDDRLANRAPSLATPIPSEFLQKAPAEAGPKATDVLTALDNGQTAPHWTSPEVSQRTRNFLNQSIAAGGAALSLGQLALATKAYSEAELAALKPCEQGRLAGAVVAGLSVPAILAGNSLVTGLGVAGLVGGAVLGLACHQALQEHREHLQGLGGTRDLVESWKARLSG